MQQKFSLALAVTVVAACAEPIATPTAEIQDTSNDAPVFAKSAGGEVIPGQYIVVFKDAVADPHGKAKEKAAKANAVVAHSYGAALKGFAAKLSPSAVAALRADPDVAYIEEDQTVSLDATQSGATWGIDRIDQHSLPLSGSYSYSNTGSGVTAYIIDTGIRFDHSEFGGRASTGYDAVTAGGNAADCNGHGTNVSGTVGGATYGVAKGVTLVAVRVLDCGGSGSTSGVIAGIDWVTAHHNDASSPGPDVANMSLGGGASSSLDAAVRNSIASGVTYGIAAGNGNWVGIAQDACKSSPARVTEAITVGAADQTDRKASWSNYGNCVDFFAPGVSITSSWYTSATATNTISGTSMATPHVVGAAALYLESHPTDTPAEVRTALYNNTTKGVVTSSRTANNHLLFVNY